MLSGANPSRQNSIGLMSRSFRISRTLTRTGWASTDAAVDLSRSARVAFVVAPIGLVRSLDFIRAKQHSDLKRGIAPLSPTSSGLAGCIQRVSSSRALDDLQHPHKTGEGGEHEALHLRRADPVRLDHQVELA